MGSSTGPAPRTGSPAIPAPVLPAPLLAPTAPLKLLTPHFRLSHVDALLAHLRDSPNFSVVASIGPQNAGKSSLLNHLILRPAGYRGFAVGASGAGPTTSGADVVCTPDHVTYIDTQPLQSPAVVAALLREEAQAGAGHAAGAAFTAQVTAEMWDLQAPLLLLSLAHVLLVAVTWPIPPALIAHLRLVFSLHAQLAGSLPPSPHACEVVLVLNKAAENSDDSPLATHSPLSLQSAVDALFADCPLRRTGRVGNGGGAGDGHVSVFVVPWRERGSLHDSAVRDLRAQVLGLRREAATGPAAAAAGKAAGERDWGRRVSAVQSALAHSAVLREQRKAVERRVALTHPPPPSPSPLASLQGAGQYAHGHGGHVGGEEGGAGVARGGKGGGGTRRTTATHPPRRTTSSSNPSSSGGRRRRRADERTARR